VDQEVDRLVDHQADFHSDSIVVHPAVRPVAEQVVLAAAFWPDWDLDWAAVGQQAAHLKVQAADQEAWDWEAVDQVVDRLVDRQAESHSDSIAVHPVHHPAAQLAIWSLN